MKKSLFKKLRNSLHASYNIAERTISAKFIDPIYIEDSKAEQELLRIRRETQAPGSKIKILEAIKSIQLPHYHKKPLSYKFKQYYALDTEGSKLTQIGKKKRLEENLIHSDYSPCKQFKFVLQNASHHDPGTGKFASRLSVLKNNKITKVVRFGQNSHDGEEGGTNAGGKHPESRQKEEEAGQSIV